VPTPIQIAFFNHKGGVAKTTSVFHLGWMLAQLGKTVLMVDCDPQCNLTGLVLEYDHSDEYQYESANEALNIRDGLAPAFEGRPVPLAPVKVQPVPNRPGLFVLPGHVGLAEYESQLSIAHELSGSLAVLQNIPGAAHWLIDITAKSVDADYVLIDMSPSLGAINQNLWSTSDAFIIPMAPDYFSAMALRSLARVLPKWHAWSEAAATHSALADATYPWPNKKPKYFGSIVQNYRIRSRDGKTAAPTKAYERWFDALTNTKSDTLLVELEKYDLLLERSIYDACDAKLDDFFMEISDFNSLIAISQNLSKPVFSLTKDDIMNSGSVADNQVASALSFEGKYKDGANKIILLSEHVT
jgi:cellulose biosynthesis protein BcsQ